MRPLTFFRWSLLLPLLVTAVAWLSRGGGPLRSFLLFAMLLGGMPYLLVVATLLWQSRRLPLERFVTWWRWSPFLMAFAFCICATVFMVASEGLAPLRELGKGLLAAWVLGGVYCIVVGYLYLAVAGLAYWLLDKARWIVHPPSGLLDHPDQDRA